ncbi:hypothetical protein TVAG_463910 [Trichomonas vaginalis G3]|uniref:Uncharacterized protein n=1 Tax=Trichomonas vaginalis (strain ATCC PRA-98 / G3) TaxID=412133 RepID=A2E243_TRIV3|nr:hypothetical protein TVAGG3_1048910 [Trichomonas vaginalis G3]EAY13257.1 hypothetical protein TVAG_463910 [Trichomonas vaginalis G3]KAI5494084.1 hypothetical protein TVAGG3_1048910 [Trichomonas vaginalis G3]|eukprot:XP_001325480.1 hypothetical protein [Trichomonas vaginalis G3]
MSYEAFCLIPYDDASHNECSELYNTVRYKKSEAITEKQLKFDKTYIKFYVIDSSDTFYPLLKLNTVSEREIEIKGYNITQRISIEIEKCKELTLLNVDVNLTDSVSVFDVKNMNIFWDASFYLNGKINCKEVTVFDSSWNLIQKMNQKTNVTLCSEREVKSICCYDNYFTVTTVFTSCKFEYDVLNDLTLILDHATNIKIDWGGSKTATIPFFLGINVFDKNGDIKVTFSNRWSFSNVKSLRQGYLDSHGTEITISSDYWSYPSQVFDMSGYLNVRKKGSYCAISNNDKDQEYCPDTYTILTFDEFKLASEMMPSNDEQITICVVDNDFEFPKSIFQNFVTLFANKNKNVKIYDDDAKIMTNINELHLTAISVINEATNFKLNNIVLTDSTFSGNQISTSNLTVKNPTEIFNHNTVKITNTLTLYNSGKSITFGKDSFIINDFEMKYSICPSFKVYTLDLNESTLTLKANTKETNNLPDFYFTLTNTLTFDDSLYYLQSRRVAKLLFISNHNEIHTNYKVLPKIFELKTNPNGFYHVNYGTKEPPFDYTPIPTKSVPTATEKPTVNPTDIPPITSTNSPVEKGKKPKTFFMISILIVTAALIYLIYNLLKKWRKFDVYNNRFEVSSEYLDRRDHVMTFI